MKYIAFSVFHHPLIWALPELGLSTIRNSAKPPFPDTDLACPKSLGNIFSGKLLYLTKANKKIVPFCYCHFTNLEGKRCPSLIFFIFMNLT